MSLPRNALAGWWLRSHSSGKRAPRSVLRDISRTKAVHGHRAIGMIVARCAMRMALAGPGLQTVRRNRLPGRKIALRARPLWSPAERCPGPALSDGDLRTARGGTQLALGRRPGVPQKRCHRHVGVEPGRGRAGRYAEGPPRHPLESKARTMKAVFVAATGVLLAALARLQKSRLRRPCPPADCVVVENARAAKTVTLSAARLAKLPWAEIEVGKKHRKYAGVPLAELLAPPAWNGAASARRS